MQRKHIYRNTIKKFKLLPNEIDTGYGDQTVVDYRPFGLVGPQDSIGRRLVGKFSHYGVIVGVVTSTLLVWATCVGGLVLMAYAWQIGSDIRAAALVPPPPPIIRHLPMKVPGHGHSTKSRKASGTELASSSKSVP